MIYHAKTISRETRRALLVDFQEDVKRGGFPVAGRIFTMKEDEYQGLLQRPSKE